MKPIETLHLFEDLNQELIYFLADLTPAEWLTASPVSGRTVKDLASHIIDGSMRRISMQRDHHFDSEGTNPKNLDELIQHIQAINQQWIVATRRLSPRILIDMLKKYEQEVYQLYCMLKMEDDAIFSVAWAHQDVSPNWFDVARDYTEKWHHQMQMRMAVGKPLLMSERFVLPVYETFLSALPAHLNNSAFAINNHLLQLEITGEIRLVIQLIANEGKWQTLEILRPDPETIIKIPASLGWMLFTNTDREKEKYINRIEVSGLAELASAVIKLTTVLS